MKYLTLPLFLLIGCLSFGQFSTSILDYNNVSAILTDGGVLFNNAAISNAGYEIPKGSGQNVIYAASMWFGGTDVNGQLHLSGSTFQNGMDIFPGPYCTDYQYYSDPSYTAEYGSSIWSVSKDDIDNHLINWNQPGYTIPNSILNWPGNGNVSLTVADQLAPYVDVNSDGVYDPTAGDYPNIRGDYATYIIMNDGAQVHLGTGGDVIGIEVHLMVYQYATSDYLNDLTFINARVFNRGTITYQDFTTSLYADMDIGNPMDDFVGSDSVRNMMFAYNGDILDENNSGALGYGTAPPAVGIISLGGPLASSTYYTNGSAPGTADPNAAAEYWNYMNGLWADGQPFVFGGTGYPGSSGSTTIPTSFMLSGDPLGQAPLTTPWHWTEMDTDGGLTSNLPGDRRGLMSMPQEFFGPDDQLCYDFAVVYGTGDTLSVASGIGALQNRADSVQAFFDAQNFNCQQVTLDIVDPENEMEVVVYPNPSHGSFAMTVSEELTDLKIVMTDMAGKKVLERFEPQGGTFDFVTNSEAGVYVITVTSSRGGVTHRVVID